MSINLTIKIFLPLSIRCFLYSLKSLLKCSALFKVMNRRNSSHPEATEVKEVFVDWTSISTTSWRVDRSSCMVEALHENCSCVLHLPSLCLINSINVRIAPTAVGISTSLLSSSLKRAVHSAKLRVPSREAVLLASLGVAVAMITIMKSNLISNGDWSWAYSMVSRSTDPTAGLASLSLLIFKDGRWVGNEWPGASWSLQFSPCGPISVTEKQ